MVSKNYFEDKTWSEIEFTLLNDEHLTTSLEKCALNSDELKELAKELDHIFSIVSSEIQQDNDWEPVRDVITFQHRVDISLTPNGMSRNVNVTVDMSTGETGIEEKLIGKSVQSVPSRISFNVKKLPSKHPLFFNSGKNLTATLSIQKVMKPPFKLPKLNLEGDHKKFVRSIILATRSLPFDLAKNFHEKLKFQGKFNIKVKAFVDDVLAFIQNHSNIPQLITDRIKGSIKKHGNRYDPEFELAFIEYLYEQFNTRLRQYEPNVYAKFIETMFESRMKVILTEIFKQMENQHKKIHQDIENYSKVSHEKERLKNLIRDSEMQKARGVAEEVLRKTKSEIKLLSQSIYKATARYKTAQGIILIQETYLNSLEQTTMIGPLMQEHRSDLNKLKSGIQANHISLSKELETLTRKLGMHAGHLLIQHAVYTDVEPDLDKVVLFDDIGKYDRKEVDVVLNLMPSLKESLGTGDFNSSKLLKSTLETDIPSNEQGAFNKYLDSNDNWNNNVLQRFSQQLENFIEISKVGNSMDIVADNVDREIQTLRTVITYAATESKLNLDFKNHLNYYKKVFIDPYIEVLEEAEHESCRAIFVETDKIKNNIKAQITLKYTVAEERAILSMFKQINSQLQLDNLFAANVFSKQIKNFMTRLTSHKDKISDKLMKKILDSYTTYMMGCSRMHNLARRGQSVSKNDLEALRHKRKSLTE